MRVGIARWAVGALAMALIVLAAVWVRASPSALAIPEVEALPELGVGGGEFDAIWRGPAARTGAFVDERGEAARPHSEARLAWGSGHLILWLYAADGNVEATDRFRVTLGDKTFEVSPTGALSGAPFGTRVGHDVDGTVDDPTDDDEEWVLVVLVPLSGVGLTGEPGERIVFEASRCDGRGAQRCTANVRTEVQLAGRTPSR
jgi:hypothetical protein